MKFLGVLLAGLTLAGACTGGSGTESAKRRTAEAYFDAVYACDVAALDSLAADDVVISYPIFESVVGTPAIRGRRDVAAFAARFCSRWSDPEITIHEAVEEGDRVVLVWEFAATEVVQDSAGPPSAPQRRSWGGISFIRFDASGRVLEELGEESTPGPMARLRAGG